MFEAYEIGPVTLWIHSIFLLVGVWLSVEFFLRLAASAGLSVQSLKDAALWHLAAFLLCGRLFAILANYQAYVRHWSRILMVWDGDFSYVGGAIGVGIVLFFVTRTQRATFLQWLDVLMPAAAFGYAFDWVGMFFGAQAYGKPTNLPWGVVMDTFNVPYSVPIHPVELYYAAFYFALTFALLLIRKHSKRAGAETLIGIAAAAVATFIFEFFRGDFGVRVYAVLPDFVFIGCLFASLGILALIEQRLSEKSNVIYGAAVSVATLIYVVARRWIDVTQHQFRFTQVLAVLALLAATVYVVVHRRKYPHL